MESPYQSARTAWKAPVEVREARENLLSKRTKRVESARSPFFEMSQYYNFENKVTAPLEDVY